MTSPNYSSLLTGPYAHSVEHWLKANSHWFRTEPVKNARGLSWRFTAVLRDGAQLPTRRESEGLCGVS